MSSTLLVVVLLAVAVVLHLTARSRALVVAARLVGPPGTQGDDVPRDALVAELARRIRVSAVGSGVGTLLGGGLLVAGGARAGTGGPDGLADVALVLTSTVVLSVLLEAADVLRRTPPAPTGPRSAALVPRESHRSTLERTSELGLVAVAVGGAVLAVATLADGAEGGLGTTVAAVGALVVIAVCALTRARLVHRAVVAQDRDDVAVDHLAGAVSADRASENLLASGGVLVLTSLLVPAVATGPGSLRTAALVLGVLALGTIAALVAARRAQHPLVTA